MNQTVSISDAEYTLHLQITNHESNCLSPLTTILGNHGTRKDERIQSPEDAWNFLGAVFDGKLTHEILFMKQLQLTKTFNCRFCQYGRTYFVFGSTFLLHTERYFSYYTSPTTTKVAFIFWAKNTQPDTKSMKTNVTIVHKN